MNRPELLQEEWHEPLSGIRRSCYYHLRREHFFETVNKICSLLSALVGAATIAAVIGKWDPAWIILFAAQTAFFGAVNYVVNPANCARNHSDLARHFLSLEHELLDQHDSDGP